MFGGDPAIVHDAGMGRVRVKKGAKPRSSNPQNRDRSSAFQPRHRRRFCSMLSHAAVPEVTLNPGTPGTAGVPVLVFATTYRG